MPKKSKKGKDKKQRKNSKENKLRNSSGGSFNDDSVKKISPAASNTSSTQTLYLLPLSPRMTS